jgi:hypothetical protein
MTVLPSDFDRRPERAVRAYNSRMVKEFDVVPRSFSSRARNAAFIASANLAANLNQSSKCSCLDLVSH